MNATVVIIAIAYKLQSVLAFCTATLANLITNDFDCVFSAREAL